MRVPCDRHPFLPHLAEDSAQSRLGYCRLDDFEDAATHGHHVHYTCHACSCGAPSGSRLLVSSTLCSIPSTFETWKEAVLARVVANLSHVHELLRTVTRTMVFAKNRTG